MVHMECMCRAYGVHVSCHLVDEAEEVAGSSRLCDGDARARCAAQRERRRTEAGGIVTGGEGAQAHNVQRGGGGSAEGEDVTRVGRAAVVCEQERACYVQRMRSALCSTCAVRGRLRARVHAHVHVACAVHVCRSGPTAHRSLRRRQSPTCAGRCGDRPSSTR